MSEATIRAQIKSTVEGVSGIGVVHDYVRWASTWQQFLTLYKKSGKINGCSISRVATPAHITARRKQERRFAYKLRFYYGLKDSAASEKIFQALIESVVTALSADSDVGGLTYRTDPVQVDIVDARMFGDVLCHYGELTLVVYETTDLTY